MAAHLADFLIQQIEEVRTEWPDAPLEFWRRIPEVLSCCNDSATFEKPLAVQAYAYVHLLERYRRTWAALKHLTDVAVLPLATYGVRILDVGTGPAPSLYAIDDFYRSLDEFAHARNIPALQLPRPGLDCIERSHTMVHFFHRFSEFCGRVGPLRPVFSDFARLSLNDLRAWHRRQNEVKTSWDPETERYEEVFDPGAAAESDGLFRHRLVVFSNFLTLGSDVENFRAELCALFQDLRPGAVAIVLGATGDSYQGIYDGVDAIAREAGLTEAGWNTDTLARIGPEDGPAQLIKESQHRVFLYLEQLVGAGALTRSRRWPDYWNAMPSPRARPRFALRIFRRGRWPKLVKRRGGPNRIDCLAPPSRD